MNRILHMVLVLAISLTISAAAAEKETKPVVKKEAAEKEAPKTVVVGAQAPEFKVSDANGKEISLSKLAEKGPVLVRLTCGCSGCDKELAYFQELHKAYEGQGLTSLAIFRAPDDKVAEYVKSKKLNMLYAVDAEGKSWKVFETTTMPTNFLIEKGGIIKRIAPGCDPSGLVADLISKDVANLLKTEAVEVKKVTDAKQQAENK